MPNLPAAIFSDVHSNLEALEAVLADIDTLSVQSRICLGDTVGYGPNPAECLERVRSVSTRILQGNHDEAASNDIELVGMNEVAQSGITYAREQLSAEQRSYLAKLPLTYSTPRMEFVHSSLDVPDQWAYIANLWEAVAHFMAQKTRLCFCGHTHVPEVWHFSDEGDITNWKGRGRIHLPETGKVLVNVGSVGQPRDQDPAACYVLCGEEAEWIEFRRVPYDIELTRTKILKAKLPRFTAQRLAVGR